MTGSLTRRQIVGRICILGTGALAAGILATCGATAAPTPTAGATASSGASAAMVSAVRITAPATTLAPATAAISSASAAAKAPGSVSMAVGDTGALVAPWNQIATLFGQKVSGLSATMTPGLGGDKVLAQIAGGGGPDLFQVDSTGALGGYVLKGAMVDLTSLFAQDGRGLLQKFVPQTAQAMTITGKQYAVAETVTSSGFYYNKRIFQEGGITEPAATWTWNDLTSAAGKLTKRNAQGVLAQAGYVPDSLTLSWSTGPTTWVWSNGGSVFNADQTKFTLGDQPAVQALQTFVDLLFKDKVSPTDADVKAAKLNGPWDFMYQAEAATWECPSWNAYLTQQNTQFDPKLWQDLQIQATPRSPYLDKPAAEFGFSRMTVMNVNTKLKDAAWQFATFIVTDDDAILTGATKNAGMPALPEKFPLWFKIVGTGRGQDIFTKNVGQIRYAEHLQTNPAADGKVWKLLNDGWADVLSQKKTVTDFLQGVSGPVHQILAGKA